LAKRSKEDLMQGKHIIVREDSAGRVGFGPTTPEAIVALEDLFPDGVWMLDRTGRPTLMVPSLVLQCQPIPFEEDLDVFDRLPADEWDYEDDDDEDEWADGDDEDDDEDGWD
jgi:hypothetical protein